MEMKKIKNVIDITGGFFQRIDNPMWEDKYSSFDMDVELVKMQGERYVSPLVAHYIDSEGDIASADMDLIANLVYNRYKEKWSRMLNLEGLEYNPIENYNMIEHETIATDETVDHTGTDTLVKSGKETTEHTGTDTMAMSGKETTDRTGTDTMAKSGSEQNVKSGSVSGTDGNTHTYNNYKEETDNTNTKETTVNGFGSNTAVPESTVTDTLDGEVKKSGSEVDSGTSSETYNNVTDTTSFTNRQDTETRNLKDELTFTNRQDQRTANLKDELTFTSRQDQQTKNLSDVTDNDVERELTRSGNIGVATASDMIAKELSNWSDIRFNFINTVIQDTLKMISMKIWEV